MTHKKKNTNFLKKTTFRTKETFILIRTINQLTNRRQMIYSDIFSYIFFSFDKFKVKIILILIDFYRLIRRTYDFSPSHDCYNNTSQKLVNVLNLLILHYLISLKSFNIKNGFSNIGVFHHSGYTNGS